MATQLILQGEIIKKHNTLIRSPLRDINSTIGQRILACLIAQIHTDDKDLKEIYKINLNTFLPSDGKSYQIAKEVSEKMVSSFVEINHTRKVDLYPIFKKISYREGIVEAKFNDDLREYLVQLKGHFTEINLLEYLLLSTTYAQRLFEILKSWAGLPDVEIFLDELHKQLNTVESQKKHFGLFRKKVLEPAQKEIIKKSES